MDNSELQQYLMNEGLSIWRLRRWIMTVRVLRLAVFNPNNGNLAAIEAELVRMWKDARS